MASGQFTREPENFNDITEEICFFISQRPDHFKAQLLTEINDTNKILELRSKLHSGDFDQAKVYIEECESESNPEIRAEALLGKSRLLCYEGLWQDCLLVAEEGLKLNPIMLTKLSLLQCQAIALFELGIIESALKNCNLILSQKKLYPEAVAVRYSNFLKLRCLIHLKKESEVKPELDTLWSLLAENKELDLDFLLCLLRVEIDLNRKLQLPIANLALFSFKVAQALGDPLYEGLALLDLLSSNSDSTEIEKELAPYREKFNKIDRLFQYYSSKDPQCLTSRSLVATSFENHSLNLSSNSKFFIYSARGLIFNLGAPKATQLPENIDWVIFKDLMKDGFVSRSDMFEKLWKQKYFYDKHDGVLRTFLHRLKKTSSIPIESEKGIITLKDTLFI